VSLARRLAVWALALAVAVACGGRSNLGLEPNDALGGSSGANGGTGLMPSGAGGTLAGRGGSPGGGAAGRGGSSGGDAGSPGGGSGARGGMSGSAGLAGTGGNGAAGAGGDAGASPLPGDDTRLRSLTVDEGFLMPSFDPATLSYTVNVPPRTDHVTIDAIAADARATVEIDGKGGPGPQVLALTESQMRLVAIVVTAPNGARATTTVLVVPELVDSTTYVKATNTEKYDRFGIALAVSGNTLAVGSYYEDGSSGGVNGDQLDNNATDSGAVYVYVKENGSWRPESYIKPAHPDAFESFGYAVALDGDTLVVGAPGEDGSIGGVNGDETDDGADSSGAVFVYTREAGVWTQEAYLKTSEPLTVDYLGSSVAVEGDTLVAGAPGHRVTDFNGDVVTVAGMASVFVRSQGVWMEQQTLLAREPTTNSNFGIDVGLSGETIVIGAYRESSDTRGVNAQETGAGATSSGAAYVFTRARGIWNQDSFLKASDAAAGDYFGLSVAISGDYVVVGSPWRSLPGLRSDATLENAGAAYVFAQSGGSWYERATLTAANAGKDHHFGARVAMVGPLVAVSAPGETGSGKGPSADPDRGAAYGAGAVYLFDRDRQGEWFQAEYIKATNAAPNDSFGVAVSLTADTLAVGAYAESGSSMGVGGDQLDNGASTSGAAYVYGLNE